MLKLVSLQNFLVWKSLGKTCLPSEWMPLEDGDWIRMPSLLFGQYPLAIFHYCLSYYQVSRCTSFILIQPSELPCYRKKNNHFSQVQSNRNRTRVPVPVSEAVGVYAVESQDQLVCTSISFSSRHIFPMKSIKTEKNIFKSD